MERHMGRTSLLAGWPARTMLAATVTTYALTGFAAADRATPREWTLAVLAALLCTLSLLQLWLIPRRLERLYKVMMMASALTPPTPGEPDDGPGCRLSVVGGPGADRP